MGSDAKVASASSEDSDVSIAHDTGSMVESSGTNYSENKGTGANQQGTTRLEVPVGDCGGPHSADKSAGALAAGGRVSVHMVVADEVVPDTSHIEEAKTSRIFEMVKAAKHCGIIVSSGQLSGWLYYRAILSHLNIGVSAWEMLNGLHRGRIDLNEERTWVRMRIA